MSTTTRIIEQDVDTVWSVLADGWLYPLFVVGASRMRDVDNGWPSVGTRLHHSVGTWPLLIDDTTEVLECEPRSLLRLKARAWPSGAAEVVFRLHPRGATTEVEIQEDAVSGPAALIPPPVRHPILDWRNRETLRRLALLAERRGVA